MSKPGRMGGGKGRPPPIRRTLDSATTRARSPAAPRSAFPGAYLLPAPAAPATKLRWKMQHAHGNTVPPRPAHARACLPALPLTCSRTRAPPHLRSFAHAPTARYFHPPRLHQAAAADTARALERRAARDSRISFHYGRHDIKQRTWATRRARVRRRATGPHVRCSHRVAFLCLTPAVYRHWHGWDCRQAACRQREH